MGTHAELVLAPTLCSRKSKLPFLTILLRGCGDGHFAMHVVRGGYWYNRNSSATVSTSNPQ